MKAYVLYAHSTKSYPLVMSIFSSYSAMLVWLDQIHNYKSDVDSAEDGCLPVHAPRQNHHQEMLQNSHIILISL